MLCTQDFEKFKRDAQQSRATIKSNLTTKIRNSALTNQLQMATNQVGVYKQAIDQKKGQKETLQYKIDWLKTNIKFSKNTAKQTIILSGKTKQLIGNEIAQHQRLQTERDSINSDSNSCFKVARDSNKGLKEAKNMKEELQGRIDYEKKLI